MILFTKSMIKLEKETEVFVRYNEKFVKSGVPWPFVKPRFCMGVFIDKNVGTEIFCSI